MAGDTGLLESEDRADDLAPFVRKLRTEIRGWEAEGIISPEQSSAILGLYDVTPESPARNVPSRVVSVIAVMGAALVGLGIIAAVAANWSAIPVGAKLVMMAVGTPALYFAGWLLIQRWGFNRIGTAVILLGAIAFGASIHLIAQIYHVPVDSPNLMAAWFLGVVPVAYITRSKAVATLAVALFFAAAGFRSQAWLPEVGDELFIPLIPVLLALAAAMFAVGRAQSRFAFTNPIAAVFTAIAMIAASGSVYVLGFQDVWSSMEPWPVESARLEYWIVFAGRFDDCGRIFGGGAVGVGWRSHVIELVGVIGSAGNDCRGDWNAGGVNLGVGVDVGGYERVAADWRDSVGLRGVPPQPLRPGESGDSRIWHHANHSLFRVWF